MADYTAFAVLSPSPLSTAGAENGSPGLEPRAGPGDRAGSSSREGGAFEPFGKDLVFRASLAQVRLARLRLIQLRLAERLGVWASMRPCVNALMRLGFCSGVLGVWAVGWRPGTRSSKPSRGRPRPRLSRQQMFTLFSGQVHRQNSYALQYLSHLLSIV